MKKVLIISVAVLTLVLILALGGFYGYQTYIVNQNIENELRENPQGQRASKVMLVKFESGRILPANYLKEGNKVFLGVDGPWWRSFSGPGAAVELYIQGQWYTGHGVAITANPSYKADVFSRLRPTVPSWLPTWMDGVLVEIVLSQ